MSPLDEHALALGPRLGEQVLRPMKRAFVGKDEIVDLLGVALAAGENLFLLGPPGTAKSALVHDLARRLGGRSFDYLLTRFTEPGELFGPFDIRRLREGELVTNTEGMLPEADLVFLDELLNANSAILNSLLSVLNERVFRRGRETRALPALCVVGASNRLPEDEALGALFDRFLVRVRCDNVPGERLGEVLEAGWRLDVDRRAPAAGADGGAGVDLVRELQAQLDRVDLAEVRGPYAELVGRLRGAGIHVSDRRAVKVQRLIAASALLSGRGVARRSDLWVTRHVWDSEDQIEVLAAQVDASLEAEDPRPGDHPRARASGLPDPEALAQDLERLGAEVRAGGGEVERAVWRDRLGALEGRVQWVPGGAQREALAATLADLWTHLDGQAEPA
jgi:MoxR-like ATPase